MTEDQVGLFDVPELVPLPNAGRAEAGLGRALESAVRDELVQDVDAGLVAAALIGARALDQAETIRDPKDRAYAVTALLPPYLKQLHALGLPVERAPVGGPAAGPTGGGTRAPDWLGDEFGPR